MRIVGGKYRSRIIDYPLSQEITRPTKDAVREGIFNALSFDVEDSVVLDLFAGSGSMGIEALSRNARKAYFVDKDKSAISTIKKNIKSLEINDAVIVNDDYKSALDLFEKENVIFDIVFLDPPYKLSVIEEIITSLFNKHLISEHAIIVIETDYTIELNDSRFIKNKNYKYGRTLVTIRRR